MTSFPLPADAASVPAAPRPAVGASRFAPRVRRALAIAGAIALLPSLVVLWWHFWPQTWLTDRYGYLIGRDFINFWYAGRLAVQGRVAEIYDLLAYHAAMRAELAPTEPFMNFSYMPNALPLVAPLGLLPWSLAYPLWLAIGIIAYFYGVFGERWREAAPRDMILVLAAPVALMVAGVAQATFILAAVFVAAFGLLPARPILSGVLMGLLSVKPHLGILLPLVLAVRREWSAFAAAAATTLGLVALSIVLFGVAPWQAFLAGTAPYQSRILWEPFGFIWILLTSPYAFFAQLGLPAERAMAVHALLAVPVTCLVMLVAQRCRDLSLVAAVTAFGTVVVSPYATSYDLVVPATAMLCWLAHGAEPRAGWQLVAIALFWASPCIHMGFSAAHMPIAAPLVLAAFAAHVGEALREKPRVEFKAGAAAP